MTAEHWNGIPTVDAAVSIHSAQSLRRTSSLYDETYLFYDDKYFVFIDTEIVSLAYSIQTDWGLNGSVDGAFMSFVDGGLYLFQGLSKDYSFTSMKIKLFLVCV